MTRLIGSVFLHGIIEWFGLEKLKDHLVATPPQFSQSPLQLELNTSRAGVIAAPLGNPFQGFSSQETKLHFAASTLYSLQLSLYNSHPTHQELKGAADPHTM